MRSAIWVTMQGLLALLIGACAHEGESGSASGGDGGSDALCDPTKPGGFRPMAAPPSLDSMELISTWTGTEVIVSPRCTVIPGVHISAYAPATDTWRELPAAPLAMNARIFWSGSEALFYGTVDCTGEPLRAGGMAYDPIADAWRVIPRSPLEYRWASTSVWSTATRELIVWGGGNTMGDDWFPFADGGAYQPATDSWRVIAASPLAARSSHAAAWDGKRMIVFGGTSGSGVFSDAAAYDPAADAWTTISWPPGASGRAGASGVATGKKLELATFFGGYAKYPLGETDFSIGDGFTYDAAAGMFTVIPGAGQVLPVPDRNRPALWWGAGRLWYWGGAQDVPLSPRGASYDPASRTWSVMPPDDLPGTDIATAAWTGCEAVLAVGTVVGSEWHIAWSLFRP